MILKGQKELIYRLPGQQDAEIKTTECSFSCLWICLIRLQKYIRQNFCTYYKRKEHDKKRYKG